MVTLKTRIEKRKHAIVIHVRSNRGLLWTMRRSPELPRASGKSRVAPTPKALPVTDETSQVPVSKMTEQDLNALVAWLRTILPID
jgi:hypothetical protein